VEIQADEDGRLWLMGNRRRGWPSSRHEAGGACRLGYGHNDRPQSRVARAAWRTQSLGSSKGRDVGSARREWGPSGVNGQSQLPCRGAGP
jgi:hypothetical protein